MHQLLHISLYLLFSVILIEVILKACWNNLYFTKALTMYKKKIEISDLEKAEKRINSFITQIDKTDGFEKYKGIKAADGLFFYRHKMITFSRRNSGGIHGTISVDSENRCVIVKWNLDYSFVALFIFLTICFSAGIKADGIEMILPLLFVSVVYVITFVFYRSKFNQLVTEVKYIINRRY